MNGMTSRGINYWESADGRDQRLIFAMDSLLQQVDAKTGKPPVNNSGRRDSAATVQVRR